MKWDASEDDVGVAGYHVARATAVGGPYTVVATTTALGFTDSIGVSGKSYFYRVSSYDAGGNESAPSSVVGPVKATWTPGAHTVFSSTTSLCQTCHASHSALNELVLKSGPGIASPAGVCLTCHDGNGSDANVKTGPTDSFALRSGHSLEETTTDPDLTNECWGCHSAHSDRSTDPKMVRASVNGTTVTAAGTAWCTACHNEDQDWYRTGPYPAPATPSTDASGYPTAGTYPGPGVYLDSARNAHARLPVASAPETRTAGDCRYCHAAHRGPSRYDSLVATFQPSTVESALADRATGDYAGACFVCHAGGSWETSGAADIRRYVTRDASDVSLNAFEGHRIKSAGGLLPVDAPLPCYDCHNPHGSSRGNSALLADTLGGSLNTTSAAGVRRTCLSCHSTSDALVWDSLTATYTVVPPLATVEGLLRNGGAPGSGPGGAGYNYLRLKPVSGHAKADPESCYACHGADYSSAEGNNVHAPSGGISPGGVDCYSCHSEYRVMDAADSARAGTYHHVMGTSNASYTGGLAPTTGPYPTSTSNLFCVSCHADHNYFNDGVVSSKGANLRTNIASSTVTTAASDFNTSANVNYGICVSCHRVSLAKELGGDQKPDGYSSATPRVAGAPYGGSSHQYTVTSSFGASAGSAFGADCSKCHNDEQAKSFQSSTYTFGTHFSAERRLLESFGAPVTDPVRENDCFGCHSERSDVTSGTVKPVAGRDAYGSAGASMDTTSQKTFKVFKLGGSSHGDKVGPDYVSCASCHNPHTASETTKVADPFNVYNGVAYGTVDEKAAFCLKCHKASGYPTYVSNDTTWVPITMGLNGGWQVDMATNGARGHWSANGSISSAERVPCDACHDKHGSRVENLLGSYDAASGTGRINGATITANDKSVCYACHTGASTGYPNATRLSNGYPTDGRWPGKAVADTYGKHSSCTGCHNVHGSSGQYDELGNYSPTTFGACFTCHSSVFPAWGDIRQYYPASAGGTSVGARAGHRTVTAGNLPAGSSLPCYDCHQVHGSPSYASLMTVTMSQGTTITVGDQAGEITIAAPGSSSAEAVRDYCFTCHTTADTAKGWTGASMVVCDPVDQVEGISRTSVLSGQRLRLPDVSGHREGDAQSCYLCHGNEYGTADSNNVHDPSGGISMGGSSCYSCHSAYKVMDAASPARAGSYHHVMGTSTVTYTGDIAPGTGTYPVSSSDVYCVSCHGDHNYFNGNKGANLRTDIAAAGSSTTNTDFFTSGNNGICVSCHKVSVAKQGMGVDQAAGGTANTPVIAGADFAASAHQYVVSSSFSGGSAFNANCSKCHSDEQAKPFQVSSNEFGTHWSGSVGILRALGVFTDDPPQEEACFKCHNITGSRYGETLSAAAKATQTEFSMTSRHDLSKVACVNCHNVHEATAASPAADPDNTYNAAAVNTTASVNVYCLKCHDGGLPAQAVNGTTLIPYTVSASARANVGTYYANDGHGGSPAGVPYTGRANTRHATMYNDASASWTNDINVLGAPDGATAVSPPDSAFEMRSTFTMPAGITSIDAATLTVRSRATGWGALLGGTQSVNRVVTALGTGTSDNWALTGATKPAAVNSNDGDTSYISVTQNQTNRLQGFTFAPVDVPANATNIRVGVTFLAKDAVVANDQVGAYLRVNNADQAASGTVDVANTAAYTSYSATWGLNPVTNAAWTPDQVNSVGTNALTNFGVRTGATVAAAWVRVTQCYMTISYDVPNANDDVWAIQYTTDGSTWTTMTGGVANEATLTDHAVDLSGVLTVGNAPDFAVRIRGLAVGPADGAGTVAWDSSALALTYSGTDIGATRADCRDCHEQHGSPLRQLLKATVDGQPVPSYTDTDDQAQCLACHRAGGAAASADIARYYPTTAHGTATQSDSPIWTRFGHRTKTAGTMPAGSALPCRVCHDPHGGANSGYMLSVRTQVAAGIDTLIGHSPNQLAMAASQQTPANANNVRKFCFTCHTTSDSGAGWDGTNMTAVAAGCQVLGIGRTAGVLKLPVLANGVRGHAAGDTTYSCYVCHGDDFTQSTSVNVHNPASGESRGGIPCYTCHTVYRDKMEDGSGTQQGADRSSSYHHVLGSASQQGDTVTYPTSATSKTNVYCLSCHVDHDEFSPLVNPLNQRAANLRSSIDVAVPSAGANTDFLMASSTSYYATGFTNQVGTWTATANSQGAGNGTVASSPANTSVFDGRHTFTFGALGTIGSASVTVRSQAVGQWGASGTTPPSSDTVDFNPTADGTISAGWTLIGVTTAGNGWQNVDEYPALNTADYIRSPLTNGSYYLFTTTPAPAVPSNATNIRVNVVYNARKNTSGSGNTCTAAGMLRVGGANYAPAGVAVNATTFTDYTSTWNQNPRTAAAWTVDEVNGIGTNALQQFGVTGVNVAAMAARFQRVYMSVTYDVPGGAYTYDDTWAIQYSVNGGTSWTDITPANKSAEAGLTDHTASLTGILTPANAANFRVRIVGAAVGTPDDGPNTIAWDSTTVSVSSGTSAQVCISCHDVALDKDAANQKDDGSRRTPALSGAEYDASAHDYTAPSTFTDGSTFNANCAKCHDGEIDGGGMERGASTTGFQTSTNKFSVHYSQARRILAALGVAIADPAPEENACYACHSHSTDGFKATDGTDWYARTAMSATAENLESLMTSTYAHGVGDYTGVHRPSSEDETQGYISANKHVECADCHNVHAAQPTRHVPQTATGNAVSGVLAGVPGVEPVYPGTNWGAATSYTQVTKSTKEYQICFKCHSKANTNVEAWGGTGARSFTDQGLEFSPSNNSYHPVVAALPNTASRRLGPEDFANGWASGDTLYCSDCHASSSAASLGPHGSSVKWMLKGPNQAWPYDTAALNGTNTSSTASFRTVSERGTNNGGTNGLFCNNCHAINEQYPHTYSSHNVACVYCHIRVPHGGKVSRLQAAVGGSRTSYPGNLPNRLTASGDGYPSAPGAWLTGFTLPATHDNYVYANCGTSNCTGDHPTANGAETW